MFAASGEISALAVEQVLGTKKSAGLADFARARGPRSPAVRGARLPFRHFSLRLTTYPRRLRRILKPKARLSLKFGYAALKLLLLLTQQN